MNSGMNILLHELNLNRELEVGGTLCRAGIRNIYICIKN